MLLSKLKKSNKSASKENKKVKTGRINQSKQNKNNLHSRTFLNLTQEFNERKINCLSMSHLDQEENDKIKKNKKNTPKKRIKTQNNQSYIPKIEPVKKKQVPTAAKKKSKQKLLKGKKVKIVNLSDTIKTMKKKPNLFLKSTSVLAMESIMDNHLLSISSTDQIGFSSHLQSRNKSQQQFKPKENQMLQSKSSKNSFYVDPNALVKIHFKKQYKKKIAAIIKIQKTWRGYQTRKLLRQYIDELEKQLKSLKIDKNGFSESAIQDLPKQDINEYHSISGTYKNEDLENFQQSSKKEQQISSNSIKMQSEQKQIKRSELSLNLEQKEKNEDRLIRHSENQEITQERSYSKSSNQQEEIDMQMYKHRRPIYSHEDIHDYLQASRRFNQESEQSSEILENSEDVYQPSVIFQTNQQYLQSRKDSKHTKKEIQSRKISSESYALDFRKGSQQFKESLAKKNSEQLFQKIGIKQIIPSLKEQQGSIEQTSTKDDYKQEVIRIKKQQIFKWNKMIQFIKSNIKTNGDSEYSKIMNEIVAESENNKKWLEENQSVKQKRKDNKNQQAVEQEISIKNIFKKKILEINIEKDPVIIKVQDKKQKGFQVNQNSAVVLSKENSQKSLKSRSEKNLKRSDIKLLLNEKSNNFSTTNLNDIIEIRQEMLRQRQNAEYKKLNALLQNNKMDFGQFQFKLANLQSYIQNQKIEIQKAKKQIERGLKVAAKVVAKTQRDAHILGKSIGFSKSQQAINKYKPRISHYDLIEDSRLIYVDEKEYKKSEGRNNKNFFFQDQNSSSQASSLDFTEEQLKRFKNPKFTDLEFSDLNKNVLISEQFLKSHKIDSYQKSSRPPKLEKIELQKSVEIDPKVQEYTQEIMQQMTNTMINELIIELYLNKNIFEYISRVANFQLIKPPIVPLDSYLKFIQIVNQNLPDKKLLLKRLNQQITPSPLQLLKCMRVDFYDDQQPQDIQQAGKYEFIIPQSVCMLGVSKMTSSIAAPPKVQINLEKISVFLDGIQLPNQLKIQIETREKILSIKRHQALKKGNQIFNVLMHCVFDSWNEQIISLKSNTPGFSGIGLNEISQSLKDHNIQVVQNGVNQYIQKSKQKTIEIIKDTSDLNKKINEMAYEDMCQNEASWINYTDEALGYVLELDYLIGQQLMGEVARFLHTRMVKFNLLNKTTNRLIREI